MARRRLLITRPADQAAGFAADAEAAGFETVLAPMLHIHPIAGAGLQADLAAAQAVLITSSAAIPFLADATGDRDLPVLTVGDATAKAASAVGFGQVESAGKDGAALAELVRRRLKPERGPLVHVAGAARGFELARPLGEAGFDVRVQVAYEAAAATEIPAEARHHLATNGIDDAAFFSRRTAETFVSLLPLAGLEACAGNVRAACLSRNVAAGLGGAVWRDILIAARPTAAALLDILAASRSGAAPDNGAGRAE